MAKTVLDEDMRFNLIVNGNAAQKELYELEQNVRSLNDENKSYRAEQAKLVKQNLKGSDAYKNLSAEIRKNNKELKQSKNRMVLLQKEIGVTSLTMRQLQSRSRALKLELSQMGEKSAGRKKLLAELKQVDAQLAKLRGQAKSTNISLGSVANGFNKYAALGATVIATLTGIAFSVEKLIDFNGKLSDSLANVRKTTGMTDDEVNQLATTLGRLQTRTNRIDLLKIAEEGGRIGIAKDEIADFVEIMDKAVVALGDSFPGGVEETASKLGKLKLLFKETKDQSVDEAYNAIGSAINELGANSVATEVNIANFATRVGSLPDALKPTIQDALALGAGFEESGIQAEIAGRAYSILLNQASQETAKFAQVMGLTNEQVTQLINDDPLEFMVKFAKGLKGMNATDTAQTLQFLGVQADGANKVLGALSNNTDRFTELLDLSNKSMQEGTSLINEYNIKNNNFAANLDKIGKRLRGLLIGGGIPKALNALVTGFGKLIGAIEKTSAATEKERINLLVYESKLKDVNTSNEDRLKLINELKKQYPGFLANINAEKVTNEQLTIAISEVNDQLINKIILQDRDAEIEEQNQRTAEKRMALLDRERKVREQLVKIAKDNNVILKEGSVVEQSAQVQTEVGMFGGRAIDPVAELSFQTNELKILQKQVNHETSQGNILLQKRNELFKKLNIGGGSNPDPDPDPDDDEDDNGSGGSGGGGGGGNTRSTRQKSLLDFQKETEDARLAIIGDSFKQELEMQRVAHERKIADLQSQKRLEGDDATAINSEINQQIEIAEQVHQLNKATILENALKDEIEKKSEYYSKEKRALDDKLRDKLISEGDYLQEVNALQENASDDVIGLINAIAIEAGAFRGLDLELLTPEQVAEFEALGDAVIEKMQEIFAKSKGKGGEEEQTNPFLDAGLGGVDIFGFSIDQWTQTFSSLDTTVEKLDALGMVLGATMDAWGMYYDFLDRKAAVDARNFDKNQDKKRESLQNNLDKGLINQRQYDAATKALEDEKNRFQAEQEYKRAKRDKEMALSSIIINTGIGVAKAWAASPLTAGLPWSALIAAMGLYQGALVAKTPLPAKGFEDGFYGERPIRRTQDGKVFNAGYGGKPTSQLVDSPKYFLAGEGGKDFPEMIIDGRAFRNFRPDFKDALYREIGRAKGYENGYYPNKEKSESSGNDSLVAMLLEQNISLLQDLRDNPITAYLPRTMQNAKHLKEDIEQYQRLRNKNKR